MPLEDPRHASGTRGIPLAPEAVHPKWMICLEGLRHSLVLEAASWPSRLSLALEAVYVLEAFLEGKRQPRGQETASSTRDSLRHPRECLRKCVRQDSNLGPPAYIVVRGPGLAPLATATVPQEPEHGMLSVALVYNIYFLQRNTTGQI